MFSSSTDSFWAMKVTHSKLMIWHLDYIDSTSNRLQLSKAKVAVYWTFLEPTYTNSENGYKFGPSWYHDSAGSFAVWQQYPSLHSWAIALLPSPHQNQELHLWHDHPPVAPKHHSINKTAGNTAETEQWLSEIQVGFVQGVSVASTRQRQRQ